MHPRERVLELTKRLREQNEEIPNDLAALAEQLGLFVSGEEAEEAPALTIDKPKVNKEFQNG